MSAWVSSSVIIDKPREEKQRDAIEQMVKTRIIIDMEVMTARGFQSLSLVYQSPNSKVFRGSHPGCAICTSEVAIKLQIFSSFESIRKAYLEVQLMSGLRSHPNIVRFCESFDYQETENTWVLGIVTEWADKDLMQDLGHRRTNSYPWAEADFVQIAHSLISGLAYLERLGIAHRDIKPQNIFYSPFTKVAKIGDFGSAKSIFSGEDEHSVVGTPAYMSAELKKAMTSGLQRTFHNIIKSDVYSLGLTFLTIATLEAPRFDCNRTVASERSRQQITALNYSDYSKGLMWEMLEIDPQQRPTFVQLEEKYCSNPLPAIEVQPKSVLEAVLGTSIHKPESHIQDAPDPQFVVDEAKIVEPSGGHVVAPFPDPRPDESDRLKTEHQNYICCSKKNSDTPPCDIPCTNHGIISFCGMPCLIQYVENEMKGDAKKEVKCPVCDGLLDIGTVVEQNVKTESVIGMDELAARCFQVLELVRQSPNSKVFRGSHPGCPTCTRQVTIKLRNFSSIESIEKAYLEVQLMNGLSGHPNIVRFCESFDYQETENTWVLGIVTEWADKDLMQDLVYRRTNSYPWPEADFVQIAHSLISGLAYLERQGMAHRDIKPQHIFYSPITKVAKIGDFGSAKSILLGEGEHTVVGTPAYMSAELKEAMASGFQRTHHDMIKSDVYSLGLTLLTIATLEAPRLDLNRKVASEWSRQQITALNYSYYSKRLIWKMLEIDPQRRPTFVQLEEKYCLNLLPTIEVPPESASEDFSQTTTFQSESHIKDAPDPQFVVDEAKIVEPSGGHVEAPFPYPRPDESNRLIAEHQNYICCSKKTSDTPPCDISCRNYGIIRFCGMPCLRKYVETETKGYTKEEAKCPVCVGLLDYGAVIEAYGGRERYLNYLKKYNDPAVRCVSCKTVRATHFLECGHIYCKDCLQAYEQSWLYTTSYICSDCGAVISKKPTKLTEVSWLSRLMLCGTQRKLEDS